MLHIVMHYQEGWGGGNFTGHGLRFFEIFNEPDSSCSWHPIAGCGQAIIRMLLILSWKCGKNTHCTLFLCLKTQQNLLWQFWNRTASDFYDLFDGIARAVKGYDPTLIVGGPGAALADEGPGTP